MQQAASGQLMIAHFAARAQSWTELILSLGRQEGPCHTLHQAKARHTSVLALGPLAAVGCGRHAPIYMAPSLHESIPVHSCSCLCSMLPSLQLRRHDCVGTAWQNSTDSQVSGRVVVLQHKIHQDEILCRLWHVPQGGGALVWGCCKHQQPSGGFGALWLAV